MRAARPERMPERSAANESLGLPAGIRACLFDLDGVLTQTAELHAEAWKQTFDAFLRDRSACAPEPFVPFDPVHDYRRFVDGRPRYDGVRALLAARTACRYNTDPSYGSSPRRRMSASTSSFFRSPSAVTTECSASIARAARKARTPSYRGRPSTNRS